MKVERHCKIIRKDWLNRDTVYMVMEAGDMVRTSWRGPGQFIHIKCGDGVLLRRPISICSCSCDTPEDLVSIVFEARGAGTQWLVHRRVGDGLDILGLLGNGFQIDKACRYLLVGGGIGVPPIRGCAQYTQHNQRGKSTAIVGFRSKERAILLNHLEEECVKVLPATDDGSLGYHGYVDELVRHELEQDGDYDAILACGPKPMLKNVAEAAAQFGIPCQVSMEERMGCGVGACLVCACNMADGSRKHVCKAGPVFDAKEVDWNG